MGQERGWVSLNKISSLLCPYLIRDATLTHSHPIVLYYIIKT